MGGGITIGCLPLVKQVEAPMNILRRGARMHRRERRCDGSNSGLSDHPSGDGKPVILVAKTSCVQNEDGCFDSTSHPGEEPQQGDNGASKSSCDEGKSIRQTVGG